MYDRRSQFSQPRRLQLPPQNGSQSEDASLAAR